jgi:protein tyrosine phosphatase (PTP) superfamily phosphohydrolase (DUF442 family)
MGLVVTAMRSLSSIPRGYVWIAGLILFALLAGWWIWANFFQTYHLAVVKEGVLYRDGFRTMREFQTGVGRARPKLIISLVDYHENENEPFSQEMDYCRRAKIKYTQLPIKLGGWPTSEQVKQFLDFTRSAKFQPVLVHCAQGVRRTGMMVAAYQMSELGWDKEKTKAAMLTFGHSQRTVGDVTRFIDEYDPKTGHVPEGLPVGQE